MYTIWRDIGSEEIFKAVELTSDSLNLEAAVVDDQPGVYFLEPLVSEPLRQEGLLLEGQQLALFNFDGIHASAFPDGLLRIYFLPVVEVDVDEQSHVNALYGLVGRYLDADGLLVADWEEFDCEGEQVVLELDEFSLEYFVCEGLLG